jgi:hypothetical protein
MDPNANLKQQEWLLSQLAVCKGPNRKRNLETELSELRQALYDWIRDGGFEPDWTVAPKASAYFIGNKEQTMAKKTSKRVAEKKLDSTAEKALLPEENQEESVLSDPSFIETKERKVATITLKFKGTQKNGIHTFSDESRGASVYVNKSMFGDAGAPAELTIEAPEGVFAAPGAGRAPKAASPEKAAKLEAKLAKDEERAKKAADRLQKQKDQLARLNAALGKTAEQPSA